MNSDETLPLFIAESRELLDDMERALLALTRGEDEDKSESVNAIFRAAHTIKGSAGLFALDRIIAFTHVLESLLDRVRVDELAINKDLVSLLLECNDHIGALMDALEHGTLDSDKALHAQGVPLTRRLQRCLGKTDHTANEGTFDLVVPEAVVDVMRAADIGGAGKRDTWHISLRFGQDVLRHGMDPLSFLRYLDSIGTVTAIETLSDSLPHATKMDPEACYLGFEIALRSSASKQAIENVFEFVRDDCAIPAPTSRIEDYIQLIESSPESPDLLGEILVRGGTLTARAPHT